MHFLSYPVSYAESDQIKKQTFEITCTCPRVRAQISFVENLCKFALPPLSWGDVMESQAPPKAP